MDHKNVALVDLRNELVGSRRTALVRALIAPGEDGQARLVAVRAIIGSRPQEWQDKTWVYTQCVFSSGRVSARRLASWLEGGGERKLTLGPLTAGISFPESGAFTQWHVPSLADYNNVAFPWPSFQAQLDFANGGQFNAPQGYFVGQGDTPSFPTFGAAFNAFFYDRYAVTGVSNSLQQGMTLQVMDQRARIQRVRIRPASIEVWLGGNRLKNTALELGGVEYRASTEVKGKRIVLPLPNGVPSDAWLWVKQDGEWLDFRPLSQWGGKLSPDIEFDFPRDVGTELNYLATRGEGPRLEYKEKLPDNASEKRNVLKTVVAYANGEGGTVLFGLEDETLSPKGLTGNRSDERRRLNDMLRDLISPPPQFRIEEGALDGKFLLVLHVDAGNATIHALTLDKSKPEYYVRRDGSTYYAKPEELEAIVERRQ